MYLGALHDAARAEQILMHVARINMLLGFDQQRDGLARNPALDLGIIVGLAGMSFRGDVGMGVRHLVQGSYQLLDDFTLGCDHG